MEQVEIDVIESHKLTDLAGLYLCFRLSKEVYGISILQVVEIISVISITPIPKSMHFLKGIINLRGEIIPVIDLRLKFSMAEAEQTKETCIVVVTMNSPYGCIRVGLYVDAVQEVVGFTADKLAPAPKYGITLDEDFIAAMAKTDNERIVILIDVEKALQKDTQGLAHISADSPNA